MRARFQPSLAAGRACLATASMLLALLSLTSGPVLAAESAATVQQRLSASVQLLASDEFEGRGVGTEGLDKAAKYIHDQFDEIGLKVDLYKDLPYQAFNVTTGARLGEAIDLRFIGPDTKNTEKEKAGDDGAAADKPADKNSAGKNDKGSGQDAAEVSPEAKLLLSGEPLKLKEDYSPLAIGGSNRFHAPLVFVGYGITARDIGYDDYQDVDVQGKVVIVLRHEPEQTNPHSQFEGTDHARHAFFNTKVSNAYQHGAAAVILVNDKLEIERSVAAAQRRWQAAIEQMAKLGEEFKKIEKPTREQLDEHRRKAAKLADDVKRFGAAIGKEYDPVFAFDRAGNSAERPDLPVLHVRRGVIDALMKLATGKDLASYETAIDQGPTPHSVALTGWRVRGQTDIEREEVEIANVIGVLEGSGPHADETVVIGAHYDHLGYGGPGSAAPRSNEVHNGADDNASGTAVLLEIARRLAVREKPPARRIVFIAFSGEERGLLGSAHYARHPLFPLEKTVAMLNMDMVGRLQENKLIVHGTGTAKEFDAWVEKLNAGGENGGFELVKKPGGFGPSDHATFYAKQIPVLHFFTGTHRDYHKPTDDADKVDIEGMQRVADLVTAVAQQIAETPEPPTYVETKQPVARRGGTRPYLGSIPDFRSNQKGYAISGTAKDSPAQRAGLKGGDVIIRFGESKIGNLEDIDGALRKYKAGDKVKVVVRRDGQDVELGVVLDPPR